MLLFLLVLVCPCLSWRINPLPALSKMTTLSSLEISTGREHCQTTSCTEEGLFPEGGPDRMTKRASCVFSDIRDKNAVNQGFWSKTAVFSLPATKVHCFLIFWLPHLYNLLQPGIRKQQKFTSIHEYLSLAIKNKRMEDYGLRTED